MSADRYLRPSWLDRAYGYLHQAEYPGIKHNPKIIDWWQKIHSAFRDDETPWCAAFVGGVLEECGILSSRSAAARSYMNWGKALDHACLGAIVVFWRDKPTSANGHVGIVVGKNEKGQLLVLGGNQGDCVSIKAFDYSRVLGYRWPKTVSTPPSYILPMLNVITGETMKET